MNEETTVVYEPPAFVELGDFSDVTLGNGGGGFDTFWECAYFCDR